MLFLVSSKRYGWGTDQLCIQTFSYFVIPLFPFIIPFITTGRVFPEALTLLRDFRQAESSAWQFQKTVSVWKNVLRGVLYLRV